MIGSGEHSVSAGLRDQTLWIALGGMVWSLLVGAALVAQPGIGLALLLAPAYAALVLFNLTLGLALWVPLTFLGGISALNAAGKDRGLLVAGLARHPPVTPADGDRRPPPPSRPAHDHCRDNRHGS